MKLKATSQFSSAVKIISLISAILITSCNKRQEKAESLLTIEARSELNKFTQARFRKYKDKYYIKYDMDHWRVDDWGYVLWEMNDLRFDLRGNDVVDETSKMNGEQWWGMAVVSSGRQRKLCFFAKGSPEYGNTGSTEYSGGFSEYVMHITKKNDKWTIDKINELDKKGIFTIGEMPSVEEIEKGLKLPIKGEELRRFESRPLYIKPESYKWH